MKRLTLLAALCAFIAFSALVTESVHATLDVVTAVTTQPRPQTVAINAVTRRVYVAHDMPNTQDSIVTVINADTKQLITTITVGKTANNIAVNEVTNRVYVSNADSNSVSVIDGGCNCVINSISITPQAPNAVAVDEAANRIIVGTNDLGHVEIFNGANDSFICESAVFQFPESVSAVAANPTNGRVYVHYNPGRGAIVDGSNCGTLLTDISTCGGGHAWRNIEYNPTDNRFYAVNDNGSSVGGYSGSTGAILFCEGFGVGDFKGTALNVASQRLYGVRGHNGQTGLYSMSISNPADIESLDPGLTLDGLVYDPMGCELFAARHEIPSGPGNEVWVGSDVGHAPDVDCDQFFSPQQEQHRGPSNTNATKDNCPTFMNDTQSNADGNFVDNSPPLLASNDDKTWPNSDAAGDACDTDDDNDGISDADEATGAACAGHITDPLLSDTDGDRVLDGAECALVTDPTSAASKPTAAQCGPTTDSDGDRLSDRTEFCGYNTDPNNTDTDGDLNLDGSYDGCEAASLNGDRNVNAGDQLLMVLEMLREASPSLRLVSYDINKDGAVNAGDQLLIAQFIATAGQCPNLPTVP